jgi:hypothetical protein
MMSPPLHRSSGLLIDHSHVTSQCKKVCSMGIMRTVVRCSLPIGLNPLTSEVGIDWVGEQEHLLHNSVSRIGSRC